MPTHLGAAILSVLTWCSRNAIRRDVRVVLDDDACGPTSRPVSIVPAVRHSVISTKGGARHNHCRCRKAAYATGNEYFALRANPTFRTSVDRSSTCILRCYIGQRVIWKLNTAMMRAIDDLAAAPTPLISPLKQKHRFGDAKKSWLILPSMRRGQFLTIVRTPCYACTRTQSVGE